MFRKILAGLIGVLLIAYGFLFLKKDYLFAKFISLMTTEETLEEVTSTFAKIQKLRLPAYPVKTSYYQLRLEIERRRFLTAWEMGLRLHRLAPGYYDLEWHLAFLAQKLARPQTALVWIEKAIDYHPFEESNYLLKAKILDSMDLEELAKDSLLTARKLSIRNRHFKAD
ncbi:hypothetical protein HOF92_01160 [bacterium]|jgi:hypothetical protein|nr:hypothetical protein [bacterium]